MPRRGGSTCAFWELELGLLGLCFSQPSPPAEGRGPCSRVAQQESILLPLNVVKRRGGEGEGKFKAVLKKVGRFREGDVRNRGQKEGEVGLRRHCLRRKLRPKPTSNRNQLVTTSTCLVPYRSSTATHYEYSVVQKNFPCLKFPPHFCQAKWPTHAQPIGPDGTCVTELSSINFAQPCTCTTLRAWEHVESPLLTQL